MPTGTGNQLLGILHPFINLGKLAGGESRTVSWSVQVSHLLAGRRASLRIRVQANNAKATSSEGV